MLGERVAVLAVALLSLEWFPRQGFSYPAANWHNNSQRAQRHRPRPHRHGTDKLSSPPPTTVVLVIASQRPTRADTFGDHFPQTGRFSSHHKTGQGRPRPVLEEDADFSVPLQQQDGEGCWAASLAALAASGTALAYQKTDPDASSTIREGDATGRENALHKDGIGAQQQQQQQQQEQHSWRAPQPWRWTTPTTPTAIKDINMQSSTPPPPLLKHLRGQLSSHLDSLSSWSSEQRDQLRRRQTAAHQQLVFFHEASSLLLVRRLREGGQTLNSAARGAAETTNRRASQLSELTVEAGRRAAGVFSIVRLYGESGLRISGRIMHNSRGRWRGGLKAGEEEEGEEEGEYEGSRLARLVDTTVQNVVDVVARDGWEHVATTSGVVVHRQYIALGPDGTPAPPSTTGDVGDREAATASATPGGAGAPTANSAVSSSVIAGVSGLGGGGGVEGSDVADASKAPQFACVKATAILAVPPEVVYLLFADNSRVAEYNEHCREVMDLEILSPDSKITWAASGRMGPFKARDFCTLVHFRTLSDGTLAQVSRPVEHAAAPRTNRYVRSEILLAGNFMRPVPGDPSRTEFLMVTHVNPGGAAETRAGAMLVNSLCASSPVNFIRRLEVAAQKLMHELQDASHAADQQQQDGVAGIEEPI